MTSKALENLVKTGILKEEPADKTEIDGLVRSARARLLDAKVQGLSKDSKFDLAYAAAHAFALAALRWHGFRTERRYIVFQCTQHTLSLDAPAWKTLADCHNKRNVAEYEGYLDVGDALLEELMRIADELSRKVAKLPNEDEPGRGRKTHGG